MYGVAGCEEPSKKSFVSGYLAPTRQTVQRQMQRLHSKHSKTLVSELKTVDYLSVTTDFWTDKRLNSYLCLTGHFINAEFKMVSTILAFTVFHNRHTGDHIAEAIKKELVSLGVYDKVKTITCDGASNVQKSFESLLPKRIQCWAHKLHLTVCNGLCLWVKSTPAPGANSNTTDSTVSDNEDEETEIVISALNKPSRELNSHYFPQGALSHRSHSISPDYSRRCFHRIF